MKIDLHCHTVYSGDSTLTPLELIKKAKSLGLDGVAVTEHMSFEASAPADEAAAAENFILFRGVEVSTDLGHFQLFGVEDDSWNIWGMAHYVPARPLIERAKTLGLVVVAAHPFGRRDRYAAMDAIYSLEGLDAIETANGRSTEKENSLSRTAAVNMNLPMTGGSDCHRADEVGNAYTVFENRFTTLRELMEEIRAGRSSPLLVRHRPG